MANKGCETNLEVEVQITCKQSEQKKFWTVVCRTGTSLSFLSISTLHTSFYRLLNNLNNNDINIYIQGGPKNGYPVLFLG